MSPRVPFWSTALTAAIGSSSLDMPAFAFPSASSSGTSTPCYSDGGGMSLPHTPLPGTPLGLEKVRFGFVDAFGWLTGGM